MEIRKSGQFPLVNSEYAPEDYVDDHYRGSVEYNAVWKNYSFHKVSIPDGTTISDANFTQWQPNTLAVTGKNLTFINCNLTNVAVDWKWKLKDCMTQQVDLSKQIDTPVDII